MTLISYTARIVRMLVCLIRSRCLLACLLSSRKGRRPEPQRRLCGAQAGACASRLQRSNHRTFGNARRVVLQNGISTRSRSQGIRFTYKRISDHQGNRIVVPVGSYRKGNWWNRSGLERSRAGEFRLRLDTLILPNGYTVS